MTPTFSRIWLVKTQVVLALARMAVSLRKAWLMSRACIPIVAMPISPSNSALGTNAATAVPVVVHKFPSIARTTEAHLVHSTDSIAMRPMTIEEAVKECEFRDRAVFVFRDPKGQVKVLHRRKDGKIELIEVP